MSRAVAAPQRRRAPWAVGLVALALGFLLSTQFKLRGPEAPRDPGVRTRELAVQLQRAERERDALMAEVEELRSQLIAEGKRKPAFTELARQLEEAQLAAGLIPVIGPGVTVTLDDSTRPVTPGENPNNFIIHDEDILKVRNDLAAAGAEALSINGQRVMGWTEVRCVGPVVTVNGVRTTVPVVITAVGDAASLASAIDRPGGIAESLKPWGIQVQVRKETSVTVPAYRGSLKLEVASPLPSDNR